MPQPKSKPRGKSAGKSASARKGTARKRTAGTKRSGSGSGARSTAKRSTASRSTSTAGSPEDVVRANLKAFRDALASSVRQLNLMMVSRDRIQEVLDDAVRRGRVTRDDANDMVSDLVRRGRRQTDDLMKDLEQLLGRSRDQLDDARKQARTGATRARRQPGVDRVLREVDRGRRAAGLPPSFPILGYDDLSAAQINERLVDLSPAELRKVRDYERRNANRKSVLTAIEKALA
jgi:polyhydroxyalkanoate synthesis regulator phasin